MPETVRDRTVAWTAGGLGALVLAFVAPIGLASAEAVGLAEIAAGGRRPFAEAMPLPDLLARFAALIPVGHLGMRAHLVAVLAGVLVLALMTPRTAETIEAGPAWGWAGALGLLALSRPFLDAATVHPAVAVDLALFVAATRLAAAVHTNAARSRAGLTLAFLCGLASGGGWPVRIALWPMGLLLALRALRLGHRWPLWAPALFGAGWLPLVGSALASEPAPTITQLFARIFAMPAGVAASAAVPGVAIAVGEDLGVLAMLVAALGLWTLIKRPGPVLSVSVMMWLCLVVAAAFAGTRGLAHVAAVAALAAPVAAGVGALSQVFGRARGAVALVVAVIVVVPAAWAGVGGALAAPGRRAPGAIARRLDAAVGARGNPVRVAPAAAADAAYTAR